MRASRTATAAACWSLALASIPATATLAQETIAASLPIRVDLASSDGARTVETREAFAIERGIGASAMLEAIGPDGTIHRLAARLAPDGEVMTDVTDQLLACYNLALATVDGVRRNGRARIPLDANFSGVPIPLTLDAAIMNGGRDSLDRGVRIAGESDGMLVSKNTGARFRTMVSFEGQMVVRDAALRSAIFTISTFAGTPLRAMGGSTCAIDATSTDNTNNLNGINRMTPAQTTVTNV